jgi:hypothetical protein
MLCLAIRKMLEAPPTFVYFEYRKHLKDGATYSLPPVEPMVVLLKLS